METVIIVGVLDKPESTNVSMAKAFIKKGFSVIPINYRSIINKYGHDNFRKVVIETVKKYKPFLILFCKCNGIDSNIITECNKYTKTGLWMPDVIHEQMPRYPEIIEHSRQVNFSAITGGGVVNYFERQGAKNCHRVFDGVDTDLFKPVDPVEKFKSDISLIGTKLKHRDEIKNLLILAGYNVRFFGDGYEPAVYNNEFSQVCCSSKYALSVNTICLEDGFSNRLPRLLGTKTCVLHYDPTGTIGKYFKDGKEIILFKTIDELITKLKYINNIEQIAENGYNKVISNYTWDNTIERILNICKDD